MKAYGGLEIWLLPFITSSLREMKVSVRRESPSTHLVVAWVGDRPRLDALTCQVQETFAFVVTC